MKTLKGDNKDLKPSIPASELKTDIEHLMRENNLYFCSECGKCSAICPMSDVYGEYVFERSPRAIVKRLLSDSENIDDKALWYCLTCQKCAPLCPSGIFFQRFMAGLRELLIRYGFKEYALFCPQCGRYILPKAEFEYIQKMVDREKMDEYLSACHECTTIKYGQTLKTAIRGGRFQNLYHEAFIEIYHIPGQ